MTPWAARIAPLLIALQLAQLMTQPFANAAEAPKYEPKYEKELQQIPSRTTAPPKLGVEAPRDQFKCERLFIYRGKELNCDSNVRQDAERLRPILQAVPEAVEELNIYQKNRRSLRGLAYVGTAGFLIAVASMFIPHDPNAEVISARQAVLVSGAAIAGGSLFYGLSLIRTNEAHLGAAVEIYNKGNPKDPIELKFSTGITF
jgi:hypothetical protein